MKLKTLVSTLAVAGVMVPSMALATNGMNLEGYGPIATGMGGASMAYDNGVAAVMNNPATLGLAPQGDRLDLAVGGLHPDITTKMNGMSNAKSDGDAYYMPAGGWARKKGNLAYGFAVMAQGGMGTEYGNNTFLSMGDAGPTGKSVRSEVGVGRAIAPLAFDVNPQLTIAASLELVWAGMDLQMLMPGSKMGGMMMPGNPLGSVSGSMVSDRFFPAMGPNPGQMSGFNWGYFDFSNSNDFSGKAHSTGWAGTLGATYKISPQLTIGGSYHGKTALSDMEGSANVSFEAKVNTGMAASPTMLVPVSVSGRISVRDFQWPETYGFGLAYQANDKLMIAADYKRIGWASVMKDFKMTFDADVNQTGAAQQFGLGGTQMNVTFNQNWKDQDVFQIGASYKATAALTLRAGMNLANNPVPDSEMNALFPAIVKDHYTLGAGYAVNKAADVNFSYSYAPNVTSTNNNMGYTTEHSQPHNWQLMYSQRF